MSQQDICKYCKEKTTLVVECQGCGGYVCDGECDKGDLIMCKRCHLDMCRDCLNAKEKCKTGCDECQGCECCEDD